MRLFRLLSLCFRRTRGATSIEYALIASLIGIGVILGVAWVGQGGNGLYDRIDDDVADATTHVSN
jgi:Flp pilus assembly pilin Flp